jgi:hypothetical protein
MTLTQIFTWIMNIDLVYLSTIGFFVVIGALFLITAVYSLIYDKAFRKKYLGKLSMFFVLFITMFIGLIYFLIKYKFLII